MKQLLNIISLMSMLTCIQVKSADDVLCPSAQWLDLPDHISLFVFGELHGNNESPQAFADQLCHELGQDQDIIVALELPTNMQDAINEWINSTEEVSQSTLLAHPFWDVQIDDVGKVDSTKSKADGRSSLAMFKLIEQIRQYNQAFGNIQIATIDGINYDQLNRYTSLADRDHIMAGNINLLTMDHPGARVMVLVGNAHAKRAAPNDSPFTPMASLLETEHMSIHLMPLFGTSWNCHAVCGIQHYRAAEIIHHLQLINHNPAYDVVLNLGFITASPPAITSTH